MIEDAHSLLEPRRITPRIGLTVMIMIGKRRAIGEVHHVYELFGHLLDVKVRRYPHFAPKGVVASDRIVLPIGGVSAVLINARNWAQVIWDRHDEIWAVRESVEELPEV